METKAQNLFCIIAFDVKESCILQNVPTQDKLTRQARITGPLTHTTRTYKT
jgi:hypothetical protein